MAKFTPHKVLGWVAKSLVTKVKVYFIECHIQPKADKSKKAYDCFSCLEIFIEEANQDIFIDTWCHHPHNLILALDKMMCTGNLRQGSDAAASAHPFANKIRRYALHYLGRSLYMSRSTLWCTRHPASRLTRSCIIYSSYCTTAAKWFTNAGNMHECKWWIGRSPWQIWL